MRVLVDANVLLDVVMQRPGFFVEALEVWKAAEQHEFEALVSAISFTNDPLHPAKTLGKSCRR